MASFDPLKLASRFEHVVVADAETAAKHEGVRAVLLSAAEALFPNINFPQDEEDVTSLLRAAGEIVHRGIDLLAAKQAVVSVPAAETSSPAEPSAAGAEATSDAGSQAADGAAVETADTPAAPPATS